MASEAGNRAGVAAQLRAGARAYGAHAAELMLERSARLAAGPGSFAAWHAMLSQRVLELAVAVELEEPALLANEFAWSSVGLRARACPVEDLRLAMECLGVSLREELSGGAWGAVEPVVARLGGGDLEGASRQNRLAADGGYGTMALRFLEAALQGEGRRAVDVVVAARDEGASVAELLERVLMPAEAEVGTMWHVGEIGVGEEHAATETVRSAMSVLWHAEARARAREMGVVVGTVAEDRHDIGSRATGLLMELAGYRAALLGADVPTGDFVRSARDYRAGVVVVAATMAVHLPRVAETARALHAEVEGVRVIVGGGALGLADGLVEKVGADGYARTPSEAVALAGGEGP